MDLHYGEEYSRFREDVARFLAEHWNEEATDAGPLPQGLVALMRAVVRTDEVATRFRLKAIERGYLYPHVPRRYGGGEQPPDPLKATIVVEEFRRARAPHEVVGQGPGMLVPTLLEKGTEEQKQRFIRGTLLGKIRWCQGYSEPGAGSDLASLRTRGELVGDHWVVNGHKLWTSNADTADWMFCLVRTEREQPRHGGISYLLIDMKSPGITVQPLRQITGEADFNEVFFENVEVPAENIVGRRGEGWIVSRSTLKHERALIGDGLFTRQAFDAVVMLAKALPLRGQPAIEDPAIRQRLVDIESKVLASACHGYRLLTMSLRGEEPGLAGLVAKLYGTTLGYDIARLGMDVLADRGALAPGEESAPAGGTPVDAYLWSLGMLIAGGTANIQRNVIAERGLGLPRESVTRRPEPRRVVGG